MGTAGNFGTRFLAPKTLETLVLSGFVKKSTDKTLKASHREAFRLPRRAFLLRFCQFPKPLVRLALIGFVSFVNDFPLMLLKMLFILESTLKIVDKTDKTPFSPDREPIYVI